MFDVPEESMTVSSEQATNLMQTLDLMINIRHKPKQNTKSVIIKGIERNASKCIYSHDQKKRSPLRDILYYEVTAFGRDFASLLMF